MSSTNHEWRSSRKSEPATTSHPLGWWRTTLASGFDRSMRAAMRVALDKIEIFDEPRWRQAAAGDAASAVGLAIAARRDRLSPGRVDLAMTALALCASGGDAAACMVMSNFLRNHGSITRRNARLANSWLVCAFRSHANRNFRDGEDRQVAARPQRNVMEISS
jgi:hypothetical protein